MPAAEDPHRAVDDLVRRVRADPARRGELVALLRENHPLHAGRSAGTTARLRGFVLAAFAEVGLPDAALPHVTEELDSGDEPVLVAAAARAVHGRRPPDPALALPLVTALWNTAGSDDVIALGELAPSWPPARPTTALLEVLAALHWLGPAGGVVGELARFRSVKGDLLSDTVRGALDETIAALAEPSPVSPCCPARRPAPEPTAPADSVPVPEGIEVQDQDGRLFDLAGFLRRAPTLLAPFYTRCANPRKCSLTVSSLAILARHLDELGRLGEVQLAALSYDPGYDTPARLHRYGRDRGLPLGPAVRLLRAVDGYQRLREHLDLRVGYAGSVVNRHGVELFLLDDAQVTRCWTRHSWDPMAVLAHLLGATAPEDSAAAGDAPVGAQVLTG